MPIELNPCVKCGMVAMVGNARSPDNSTIKGYRATCCGYPAHYSEWDKTYDGAAAAWNAANPKEAKPND